MRPSKKVSVLFLAGIQCVALAIPAMAQNEPSLVGVALPSDEQLHALVTNDRQAVHQRPELVNVLTIDDGIVDIVGQLKKAQAANDTHTMALLVPKLQAQMDKRSAAVNSTLNPEPSYDQMLKWDQDAVTHHALPPIVLQYDAQLASLRPGAPEYEKLQNLKAQAAAGLARKTGEATARMGQPDDCQGPMGQNICVAPAAPSQRMCTVTAGSVSYLAPC